jgi:hypothetical protein
MESAMGDSFVVEFQRTGFKKGKKRPSPDG